MWVQSLHFSLCFEIIIITNNTRFTRSLANALKLTSGNPKEKWERDEHQNQCKLADKTHKVKKDSYNDTGLPLHHKNEHHEFQWEQAMSILEIERDVNRRRLLEAIHIYKNKDIAVNVYSGKSDIPKNWFPILDKIEITS